MGCCFGQMMVLPLVQNASAAPIVCPQAVGTVASLRVADGYNHISGTIAIVTAVPAAGGTLSIQFSTNGANWVESSCVILPANTSTGAFDETVRAAYARLVYTPTGASDQTIRLQGILRQG